MHYRPCQNGEAKVPATEPANLVQYLAHPSMQPGLVDKGGRVTEHLKVQR